MEPILRRLRHQPLSHQLALVAAGCCLLATLILVAVAAQSTRSVLNSTLDEHAQAAVANLGLRAGTELATGDRLGLAAALQVYTDQKLFSAARALDIEGMRSRVCVHLSRVVRHGRHARLAGLSVSLGFSQVSHRTLKIETHQH